MTEGKKIVTVGNKKMGTVSREVTIIKRDRTVLDIYRSEFMVQKSELTLHGLVKKYDGTPLPGKVIQLCDSKGKKIASKPTDSEGRFTLTGLFPDAW